MIIDMDKHALRHIKGTCVIKIDDEYWSGKLVDGTVWVKRVKELDYQKFIYSICMFDAEDEWEDVVAAYEGEESSLDDEFPIFYGHPPPGCNPDAFLGTHDDRDLIVFLRRNPVEKYRTRFRTLQSLMDEYCPWATRCYVDGRRREPDYQTTVNDVCVTFLAPFKVEGRDEFYDSVENAEEVYGNVEQNGILLTVPKRYVGEYIAPIAATSTTKYEIVGNLVYFTDEYIKDQVRNPRYADDV